MMDTQKLEQALEMARCADAEPRGEPVAWNQTAYAALQQARLALEDLDGPGYLIGGVMHHRIGLILPMLNAAMESLIDHPPQQRKPLTDEFVSKVVRSVQPNLSDTCRAWKYEFAQCKHWLDAAHGIGEAP